ncbi:hypothetical protein LSTR_LSTR009443 [Laodelphax striatellus]|uniref:Patched domain-containing protein n=1 Tax=Laodelphax striatellus TaxID=195883 RepID=A0A482WNK2_LAOST|nr:hypothetical protein LSTR_LSTR009443 [Laodelphax striatellus]
MSRLVAKEEEKKKENGEGWRSSGEEEEEIKEVEKKKKEEKRKEEEEEKKKKKKEKRKEEEGEGKEVVKWVVNIALEITRVTKDDQQLSLNDQIHFNEYNTTNLILSLFVRQILRYQRIQYEMDPEYLFSPEEGPGKTERAIVEHYFKMNYSSRFNPTRITRAGRFGRVIVIPRDGGDNLLSVEAWKELRDLDNIVRNATIVFGEDRISYKYDDICAKWVDHCFENDILNLDLIMDEVVNKSLNLTFPIMFNPITWDAHTFPVYFGGTVVSDDGLIVSVPSLQLVYFVTADTPTQDQRGARWEEAFLDAVGKAEDSGRFKHISTSRFASRTLDIELEKNTQSVVPYFGSTFVIMAVFSTLTSMMLDWVRSKPLLGLLGNLSAAMGTVAGFGLAVYCGIPFIGINLVSA